jgi:cold shock CspA family protein
VAALPIIEHFDIFEDVLCRFFTGCVASHEVRVPAPPERGIVTRFFPEEGYGFIVLDDGTEVYFHRNAVHDLPFDKMDGMEVTLNVEPGEKGPQATTVNPVDPLQYYADKGAA